MSNEEHVFKALASPVRREILFHLRQGELAAGDIAARFDIAAPTVSRHLGVLKGAGLVSERRESNRIWYSAAQDTIAATCHALVVEHGGAVPRDRRALEA